MRTLLTLLTCLLALSAEAQFPASIQRNWATTSANPTINNTNIQAGTINSNKFDTATRLLLGVGSGVNSGNATNVFNGVNHGFAFSSPGAGSGSEQFGNLATANGQFSLAIGNQADAEGNNSIAQGFLATATGKNAIAIGNGSGASGSNGLAIGVGAAASFANSVAIGYFATSTGPNQVMIGSAGIITAVQNALTVGGVITGNGAGLTNLNISGGLPTHLANLAKPYSQVVFLGDSRMTVSGWPTHLLTNTYLNGRVTAWTNMSGNGWHLYAQTNTGYADGITNVSVSGGVATVKTSNTTYLASSTLIMFKSTMAPLLTGLNQITIIDAQSFTFPTTATNGTPCTDATFEIGSEAMIPYIPTLTNGQVGLVLVGAGINDIGTVYNLGDSFSTNYYMNYWSTAYSNIVIAAHAKGYEVVSLTLPPTWASTIYRPGGQQYPAYVMMNDFIVKNPQKADRMVDLASLMDDPENTYYWSTDLLHFSAEGARRIASLVNANLTIDSYTTTGQRPYVWSPAGQEPYVKWFFTNSVSQWPTSAIQPGACCLVMSNVTLYQLKSSVGSTAWASTNLVGN